MIMQNLNILGFGVDNLYIIQPFPPMRAPEHINDIAVIGHGFAKACCLKFKRHLCSKLGGSGA